ncbi:hypothetical protein C2E21_1534 [Chlorella sorokiniana]|uniref:Uncharacterized protein n=1 Tax=Chlorella sorokiniana TaxID=3076 RepID=A0A2P6U0J8_CHLSO|nr:hypothetical protein C2E21_1534 [Chlorella sorokiniana]|eukprot:PRW59836.1 hypothetical protein C2E21_1534 [Chlorella sorokiniana]
MTNPGPGRGAVPQPSSLPEREQQPQGATGKLKRALQLLFGTANVSVYEVAGGEQWVSPDELSGKADDELRRRVKGKGKVGEPAPVPAVGPATLSHDSAWSIEQQQQQQQQRQQRQGHYQQPPAAEGQGVEERLRQAAAAVLGAGCPTVEQTIDQLYCSPETGTGSMGAPSPRSPALPDCERGVELAAVVTHGGPSGQGPSGGGCGGSSSWDTSLGLSSSGAWGYAPGPGSSAAAGPAAAAAAAGPSGSSSRAACSSGAASGW